MPGQPAPHDDEIEQLLAFVAQQRLVLRIAAHGLTDEQARSAPSVSPLSVGGLIKHVAATEDGWIDVVEQVASTDVEAGQADYATGFVMGDDETLEELLAELDRVAERTERVARAIGDPTFRVPVPQGVPWYPDDVEAWTLRWVLLHLVEETARHAGHADIVRESVDGATAFPLLAAHEGWPATPWIQPWEPPAAGA